MLGQCWVQLASSWLQDGSADKNVITTHFSKDLLEGCGLFYWKPLDRRITACPFKCHSFTLLMNPLRGTTSAIDVWIKRL